MTEAEFSNFTEFRVIFCIAPVPKAMAFSHSLALLLCLSLCSMPSIAQGLNLPHLIEEVKSFCSKACLTQF
jgi:hypothetical protein